MSYSKHHAKKTKLDGYTFDSLSESYRYAKLKLAENSGEIGGLRVHPRFPIVVNSQRICYYIADFSYVDKDGSDVVEDTKSEWTRTLPVYRLKKKLMLAVYGIDIVEVIR